MKGNFFICKNNVFVEGESIGQFSNFTTSCTRNNIICSANITMPFYTINKNEDSNSIGSNVVSYSRIDINKFNIKTGAHIKVVISYINGYTGEQMDEIVGFDGYINQVVSGFPTVLKCEDSAFVLKFGFANKEYPKETKLTVMAEDAIKVSNEAFSKYRDENKLTYSWKKLSISPTSIDSSFVFRSTKNISPIDIIRRIMNMYKLYASVDNNGVLWLGSGHKETLAIELDTSLNVIDRDLVTNNGYFDNYSVEVNFLENGKKIAKYRVDRDGNETDSKDDTGEIEVLPFTNARTEEQAKQIALNVLSGLKGYSNKGTIVTLPYPKIQLYDFINYTDTLFPELSAGYYVISQELNCGNDGYRQILTVINKSLNYFE